MCDVFSEFCPKFTFLLEQQIKFALTLTGIANQRFLLSLQDRWDSFVGSTEAPSKAFLLFFLLYDWLKLNHLKSRMECGFSDIFSRHTCSTVAETIGVTNYAASLARKIVQKTIFEATEIILGPWNQQPCTPTMVTHSACFEESN